MSADPPSGAAGELPRLFHLADPEAWRAARASGARAWSPPSLDAEGFVHLSFAEQVPGTLAAHFAAAERLLLVEVRLSERAELVLEPSRGGADFPHLYRPLRFEECVAATPLERRGAVWRAAVGAGPLPW